MDFKFFFHEYSSLLIRAGNKESNPKEISHSWLRKSNCSRIITLYNPQEPETSSQVTNLPCLTSPDTCPFQSWNSPDLKLVSNMHSHNDSSSQTLLLNPIFAEWWAITQYFPCIETRDLYPGKGEQKVRKQDAYTTVIISDQQRCGKGGQAHKAPRKLR